MIKLRATTADWREHYQSRLSTAEEIVTHIKSGDRIWLSAGQQVPALQVALLGRALELENVRLKGLPGQDIGFYNEIFHGHVDMEVMFASPFSRDAVNEGHADYTPWWVYGAHKALEDGRDDALPIDVAMIQVSPPNEHGYCCFGSSLWDAKSTAGLAGTVMAEVNTNIVRTFGDSWIHVSEIDWFVENSPPPPETAWRYAETDPWDRPIAEYVASLIKDGDTIQIGTGSTTGAIPRLGVLDDKQDLGYFSELTVPGTIDLVKKGVITSRRMNTHPGKFVTTVAGNGPDDLAFINDNPMFEFYGVDYIHHPGAIGRNDNMVAIDNAITTDLTGQIGASHMGPRVYSGTGGHLAYAMGAFLSKGGRYICVLPSTARGGTVSRIVAELPPGQIVTVPRDIADYVVTEYGIARLMNRSERQRAEELISVAHPDFRADLRKAFAKRR